MARRSARLVWCRFTREERLKTPRATEGCGRRNPQRACQGARSAAGLPPLSPASRMRWEPMPTREPDVC